MPENRDPDAIVRRVIAEMGDRLREPWQEALAAMRERDDYASDRVRIELRSVTAPLTLGHTRLCVAQGDWIAEARRHEEHLGALQGFYGERLVTFVGETGELYPHVGFACRRCRGVDVRFPAESLSPPLRWFANAQFAHLLPAVALYGAGLLAAGEVFILTPAERGYITAWQRAQVDAAMRAPPTTLTLHGNGDEVIARIGLDPAVPGAEHTTVTYASTNRESPSRMDIYTAARSIDSLAALASIVAGIDRERQETNPFTSMPLRGFERVTETELSPGVKVQTLFGEGGPKETKPTPAWSRLVRRGRR